MPKHKVEAAGVAVVLVGLLWFLASDALAASKEKVIYSFHGATDGASPASNLVADASGNLYGTTGLGGTGTGCGGGCGTVFELVKEKGGWKHEVLHNFVGHPSDGGYPDSLIFGSDGNLYGTTAVGGTGQSDYGTVFELTPTNGGWAERLLYVAEGSPQSLIFDSSGNLFGVESTGGSRRECYPSGCGAIFELVRQVDQTWTENTIYRFTGGTDGGQPVSIVFDASGKLIGSNEGTGWFRSCRGTGGCGAIFELTPGSKGTWTFSVLYQFGRGEGSGIYPGSLIADKDSDVTGITFQGGDGFGTIFRLHSTQKQNLQPTNLHLFLGDPDGVQPIGNLLSSDGHFVGVTFAGGINKSGTVFDLAWYGDRWHERVLHSFGAAGDGTNPQAGVLEQNGHLYGTTGIGGVTDGACPYGCGTVYEIVR
ncbi:MAG: choice-of-anchor tandem repeat GloVer-containing protein [Terriglobales bacterium]